MTTQRQTILTHLEYIGTLTSRQASTFYGVDRLAARIGELKERGHKIKSKLITVRGRSGKAHVARYSL